MVVESLARRTLRPVVLVLAAAALLLSGCRPSGSVAAPRGTAIVVFVDFSQSISGQDQTAFRREIETDIVPTLVAGDKLLIAPINDKTLTDFRPLVEATLPAKPEFNGWFDNVMKHNRRVKEVEAETVEVKAKIKTDIARVFGKRYSAPQTDIFSSLLIAQKLFYDESRRKVLVLMSDMIEDNPPYDFEKIAWSPAVIDKTLSDLDAKGLIPELTGVCIYVSGASARSALVAENIGRFWQAYFRRTGADLDPSRYAHVLLHWPPAKSCRSHGGPRRA